MYIYNIRLYFFCLKCNLWLLFNIFWMSVMKKTSLIVLSTLALSTTAMADFHAKPYVGIDYGMLKTEAESNDVVKKSADTLGLTIGAQFDESYGAEAFYLRNVGDLSKDDSLKVKFNSFGALATYKYDMENNVYLKAALGLAVTSIDAKYETKSVKRTAKETSTTVAGKLGIGYNISQNVATELTYNRLDGNNGLGLQVKYKF